IWIFVTLFAIPSTLLFPLKRVNRLFPAAHPHHHFFNSANLKAPARLQQKRRGRTIARPLGITVASSESAFKDVSRLAAVSRSAEAAVAAVAADAAPFFAVVAGVSAPAVAFV